MTVENEIEQDNSEQDDSHVSNIEDTDVSEQNDRPKKVKKRKRTK